MNSIDTSSGFAQVLNVLLAIYNGLIDVADIVLGWLGTEFDFPVFDVSNWSFTLQTFTLLQVVCGIGFVVILGGIIFKWLKEFIF